MTVCFNFQGGDAASGAPTGAIDRSNQSPGRADCLRCSVLGYKNGHQKWDCHVWAYITIRDTRFEIPHIQSPDKTIAGKSVTHTTKHAPFITQSEHAVFVLLNDTSMKVMLSQRADLDRSDVVRSSTVAICTMHDCLEAVKQRIS